MQHVKVAKSALLEAVKANRNSHRELFEKAAEGYRVEVIDKLNAFVERLKNGVREPVYLQLPFPEDHTRDYDRVIAMLEMSVDDVIELSGSEFAAYAQDDWGWKQQWLASNSTYTSRV